MYLKTIMGNVKHGNMHQSIHNYNPSQHDIIYTMFFTHSITINLFTGCKVN